MTAFKDIVILGTDAQTRNQYIADAIARAFRYLLPAARIQVVGYADLGKLDISVDLLLALGGSGAILEPLRRALHKARVTALWTTEDPYELKENVKLASLFDIVFTNDIGALPFYSGRVVHLPFAASDKYHDHDVVTSRGDLLFDLFFVGTAWPERVEQIDRLLSLLRPSLRKKIGLARNPHLPDRQLGNLDLLTDFRVSTREFARMANRSAVALTLDRTFSGDPSNTRKGQTPPPRLFEMAAAGTAQVYVSDRPSIGEFFRPGEEIVLVDSIEAAAGEIERLADDSELRNRIASAGRARALAEHMYEHRVAKLIEAVAAIPRREPAHTSIISKSRPRILLVSHNVAGIHPFGGVELYQETMADALDGFEFHVLYPDRSTNRLTLRDLNSGTSRTFDAGPIPETLTSDRLREKIIGDVIGEYGFDLVHFHHLIGHPLSLPLITNAFGVPSVFQVHDYYGICQNFNLLGPEGTYCGIRDPETDVCDQCLARTRGLSAGSQARRRWAMRTAFDKVDAVLHSTNTTLEKFQQIYPDLDYARHHVTGNAARLTTLDEMEKSRTEPAPAFGPKRPLRVAILGSFARHKGAEWLFQTFAQMRADPVEFHVIGRVDGEFERRVAETALPNVTFHGTFEKSMPPSQLEGMDVSAHFSIWPETYCLTLDEARAAGLVPVVLGYGALAERVRNGIDGVVIDTDHPMDLVRTLRGFVIAPERLAAMRTSSETVKSGYHAHVNAVRSIYERLINAHRVPRNPAYRAARSLFMSDLGIRFSTDDWSSSAVRFDDTPPSGVTRLVSGKPPIAPKPAPATLAFEPRMRPGDERMQIIVEGIRCSFASSRRIDCPAFKKTLRFGVAVSAGLDRIPVELALIGESGFISNEFQNRRSDGLSDVSEADWAIETLPAGTYTVHVTLDTITGLVRYRSGVRIKIGDVTGVGIDAESGLISQPWQLPADVASIPMPRPVQTSGLAGRISEALDAVMDRRGKRAFVLTVDHICGQLNPGEQITIRRAEHGTLRIAGWALGRQTKQPFVSVYLRLHGRGDAHLTMARIIRRPDLVTAFGAPQAETGGFEADIPMTEVDAGHYNLDVILVDPDGEIRPARRIEVTVQD